jgi:hypothetical protein
MTCRPASLVRRYAALMLFAAALVALSTRPATAADPQWFKVFLDSQVTMDLLGNSMVIKAETTTVYGWAQDANKRVLTLHSLGMKATNDGALLSDIGMNAAGLVDNSSGQPVETKVDGAPPEFVAMVTDTFGPPLMEIEVDAQGAETKRTMVAKPGAQSWVDNDVHLTCLIFHPPYVEGKDQWESDAAVSMGNGVVATGKLTYTRVPDAATPTVKVTGTLSAKDAKMANGVDITSATYIANGEMSYDAAQHEWTAGEMKFDIAMEMLLPTGQTGSSKGAMTLTFEHLPNGPAAVAPAP